MNALDQLNKYHTSPTGTHIYLDPLQEGFGTGGHAKSTYGIPAQTLHFTNKNPEQLNLDDMYLQFARGVYSSQQDLLATLPFGDVEKFERPQGEIHLHTFMHHPDLTNKHVAKIVGVDQDLLDRGFTFNHKDTFQQAVVDALGINYATGAEYLVIGDDANEVYEKIVSKINGSSYKKAVLRVADFNKAPGGGQGVLICSDPDQIKGFLQNNDMLFVDGKRLKSTILIEDFIPHTHTPTQTFFTDYAGNVAHVSTNYQFVSPAGSFLASTNILPPEIHGAVGDMTDTSLELMEGLAGKGVRGRGSIDHMYNTETGKNVKGEANLRESGTSIPNETVLKLTNFAEDPKHLGRVYMRDIYYTNKKNEKTLSFSHSMGGVGQLLERLRTMSVLIESKNDLDGSKVQVMIDYTSETYDHFDLVFMRDKRKLQDHLALHQVNTILQSLAVNQNLQFPQ